MIHGAEFTVSDSEEEDGEKEEQTDDDDMDDNVRSCWNSGLAKSFALLPY